MKYKTLIFLLVFIVVTVFGFVNTGESMAHSGSGCLISAINGVACVSTSVDFALEHIRAYNTFSSVLFQQLFYAMFLAGLLLYGLVVTFFGNSDLKLRTAYHRYFLTKKLPSKLEEETRWLSLFEHSPSA